MRIVILILSFLLIQTSISQIVTRDKCIEADITASYLPERIPVDNPDNSGPCTDNICCTTAYIDELRDNIKVKVFRKCIRGTLDVIISIAERFFDYFSNSFGEAARVALFSAFAERAGVEDDDTSKVYIYNELSYSSQLLANLTFSRIRGDEIDDVNTRFRSALREYACDYLAYLLQEKLYLNSLRIGRISGKCICRVTDVGEKVNSLIDSFIQRFTSTIDNIAKLIRAILAIRTASLQNLQAARDFNVSSICTRQYINALACQHCQGVDTRACPNSCRLVALLCLQPLRDAFTGPYEAFIRIVRLAIDSITGENSESNEPFDLHNFQEIVGALNIQVVTFATELPELLRDIFPDNITNNDCFITRDRDIADGTFKCQEDSDRDDTKPDCTREEGDKEIVDVDTSDSGVDRPDTDNIRPDSGDNAGASQKVTSESDDRVDEFDYTTDENKFVDFLKNLLERFSLLDDFNNLFKQINSCVCRATLSGDADEERFDSLLVSRRDDQVCYEKFAGDSSIDDLDSNSAYTDLTADQRAEIRQFDAAVSEKFVDLEQLVAEDPETSSTLDQLTGDTSSGTGRLLTSLFAMFSALLSILFFLV
ncbi:hypothetical protein LOD99_14336 [Oopsacas minuta]|uniref:Uncharacterized protein n=1 Tax=Oopsacas minuta TaxID=111878 RepID=A0AAV7KH42_9METZ|nr:hypothetical protein LOD99_14336 [Oopsacas minuta]